MVDRSVCPRLSVEQDWRVMPALAPPYWEEGLSVTCHLGTCRENPGILRKAQAFPKFHFGHAFVCPWLM